MFDRITYISDDSCTIKLLENAEVTMNLMNLHLIFEDDTKKTIYIQKNRKIIVKWTNP